MKDCPGPPGSGGVEIVPHGVRNPEINGTTYVKYVQFDVRQH